METDAATALAPAPANVDPRRRFTRYAWAVLGYTLLVILFGAVVRITGSGAGCGQHWPSCNGELLHLPQTLKTAIEYGHRSTSGLSVVSIVVLLVGAFRLYPRGHRVRFAASLAAAMIVVEALLGALLVKLHLVEQDASLARVVVLPLHLLSTASLTFALTWCAFFAHDAGRVQQPLARSVRLLLVLSGAGILLVSTTGAVTALGDTVYPVQTSGLLARLREDQGATAHLLQRMRGIHPFLAIAVAAFVSYAGASLTGYHSGARVRRASLALVVCVCTQLALGVLNIWLSAPGPLQVLHLLFANLAWISLVLLAAAAHDPELQRAS